jgi:thioredoxin 1
MSNVINITDQNFEDEVIKSDIPVLIDFWAEWCGPCKILGPVIDDVANDFDGRVKFTKLNIDENPDNTQKFGIRGIPTILIFKDGSKTATSVGVLSKSELISFLNENM